MEEKRTGVDGFTLKLIAIITMFIDHVGAVIVERYLMTLSVTDSNYGLINILDLVLRSIGRVAFPIFIFCMVQGFCHTSNKLKYFLRLVLFALIAEIPFNLAFANALTDFHYQNVFFTLLLGFLFMWFEDFISRKQVAPWLGYVGIIVSSIVAGAYFGIAVANVLAHLGAPLSNADLPVIIPVGVAVTLLLTLFFCRKKTFNELSRVSLSLAVLGALMWAGDLFHTDYGAFGVLAISVAYIFRANKNKSFLLTLIPLTIASPIEAVAVIDLVVIKRYNGEKGRSMKYFFYLFYPVHLLLLAGIAMILGI